MDDDQPKLRYGAEILEGGSIREVTEDATLTTLEDMGGAKLSPEDTLLVLRWGNAAGELMTSTGATPDDLIEFAQNIQNLLNAAARLIDFGRATMALVAAHPDVKFLADEGALTVQFKESNTEEMEEEDDRRYAI